MQPVSLTEVVTLPLAVLGAVLGVLNTWKGLDRDRVKMRVVPKIAYPVGMLGSAPRLCFEVVNRSMFAVSVSEVGFELKGTDKRFILAHPIMADGGSFPRRLDSRASLTVYFAPGAERHKNFAEIERAFAKTDCGEVAFGGSPKAIATLVRWAQRDRDTMGAGQGGRE